jgi:thiol:disulfide interchange protein
MKVRNIALSASALLIGMVGSFVAVRAQGPLYDKVIVDLPYTVTVRGTVLPPGHYVIRQHESTSNSRVLHIFSNEGMKLETTVMTIPTLDNNTPEDTKVILHHFGNDYYFDKIWIQGKNYGYEFVLPDEVKSRERERMAAVNVAATYEAAPAETTTTESATTTTTTQESTAAQSTAAQTEQPAQAEQPAPAPAPAPEVVQAQPAPTPAPAPEVESAPVQETGSANREMPSTAANWLTMLLGGGLLSGAGMTLRRFTR